MTGLLGQSSTCAAACAQTKNVPRSATATPALPALPCASVPTAERRKTALSRPITIALSHTSVPFAVVCPSKLPTPALSLTPSQTLCHCSSTGVGMTSQWKRGGSQRPFARDDRACTPLRTPGADDTCSNAQISDPNRSRRVRRATVERKTWGRAQKPGTHRCPAVKQARIPTRGAMFMSSPFRSRCMDTGRGTRWAPETTKPVCRCRELLPRAGVCHEEW
ncbi:MAG: hypothetical protein QOI46_4643 [Alphaproteobacteria bacterium]|nr:hypothetical protein [Alphaproteobacteria bacterium]